MNNPHLRFHHFGLAVRRPDEARRFFSALGCQIGEVFFDPSQNVYLQLCTHPAHPAVEIIWPGDSKGPIEELTQRHAGGIIYHVCYETDNLPVALEHFAQASPCIICISPPKPAPLFAGRKVSFYNLLGVGLIEILEGTELGSQGALDRYPALGYVPLGCNEDRNHAASL